MVLRARREKATDECTRRDLRLAFVAWRRRDLRRAAQVLHHVARLGRTESFVQKVPRGANRAKLFGHLRGDELVQEFAVELGEFRGRVAGDGGRASSGKARRTSSEMPWKVERLHPDDYLESCTVPKSA